MEWWFGDEEYVVFDKEWNLQAMSNLSISEKSVSEQNQDGLLDFHSRCMNMFFFLWN
jgi:hypothetical protein